MKKNSRVIVKGEVFWFDPLQETKTGISPLAVVVSGELHNQYADHLIIALASSQSLQEVRKFFEVVGEVEGKKVKVIISVLHTIGKNFFLERAKYLGKLNKETLKTVNEQIKLILELDN